MKTLTAFYPPSHRYMDLQSYGNFEKFLKTRFSSAIFFTSMSFQEERLLYRKYHCRLTPYQQSRTPLRKMSQMIEKILESIFSISGNIQFLGFSQAATANKMQKPARARKINFAFKRVIYMMPVTSCFLGPSAIV